MTSDHTSLYKEYSKIDKVYDFLLKNCVADLIHILLIRNKLKENKELTIYTDTSKELKCSIYDNVYIRIERDTYWYAAICINYETYYEQIDISRDNIACVYVARARTEYKYYPKVENLTIKISLSSFINYSKVFPESLRNIMNFLQPMWPGIMEKISKSLEGKSYVNIDANKVNEEHKDLWKDEAIEQLPIEAYFIVRRFMEDRIFTITNEMRLRNIK